MLRSDLQFEVGPIRPPSEARSLLIRATRNCPWNRCGFCPVYKGERFSLRSVAEIKEDIRVAREISDDIRASTWRLGMGARPEEVAALAYQHAPNDSYRQVALWRYFGSESAFLQDANTLVMPNSDLVEVIGFLRESFPELKRVTIYGRAKTAAKKSREKYRSLREAGLNRIHIGLETGHDPILEFIEKGCTSEEQVRGGRMIRQSGIELSEYVMPGLGGRRWTREHAEGTARVLNEIEPDFVRLRSLIVPPGTPLSERMSAGEFEPLTEDEVIGEIHLFITQLNCRTRIESDHIMNLLEEVEGTIPEDKTRVLSSLEQYLSLSAEEKLVFRVGRRLAFGAGPLYRDIRDLEDAEKRNVVEQVLERLCIKSNEDLDRAIERIRESFI